VIWNLCQSQVLVKMQLLNRDDSVSVSVVCVCVWICQSLPSLYEISLSIYSRYFLAILSLSFARSARAFLCVCSSPLSIDLLFLFVSCLFAADRQTVLYPSRCCCCTDDQPSLDLRMRLARNRLLRHRASSATRTFATALLSASLLARNISR